MAFAALVAGVGGFASPAPQRPRPRWPARSHALDRIDPLGAHGGPRLTYGMKLGHSTRGRTIRATAYGNGRATRRMLVVGCIHGTECAGTGVVRQLLAGCPPAHVDVWTIRNLNPDGHALGVRVNGRGVDLNRNFPAGWRPGGRAWDPEYPGPRPFSEPETRIVRRLVLRLRPQITVWFHQQADPLVRAWGRSIPVARSYALWSGLRFARMPWLSGTAPHWQNELRGGGSSFVVELPQRSLSHAERVRLAAALERIAGYRGQSSQDLAR